MLKERHASRCPLTSTHPLAHAQPLPAAITRIHDENEEGEMAAPQGRAQWETRKEDAADCTSCKRGHTLHSPRGETPSDLGDKQAALAGHCQEPGKGDLVQVLSGSFVSLDPSWGQS